MIEGKAAPSTESNARMAKLADAADLKSAYKVGRLLHIIENK
jgi:hypothetical protein